MMCTELNVMNLPLHQDNPTTTNTSADDVPIRILKPVKGWVPLNLHELWDYRELVFFLMWRDVKVRYKQTLLGVSWAIIQPFFTMVIFSLFFGKLVGVPSDNIPYPIFTYTALIPWTFFANGLNQATHNLVAGAHLIRKVYFPRLAMPIAAVLNGLLDFVIASLVLLAMMLYYTIYPKLAALILVPLFLLIGLATSLGVGFWLSALHVQYRDVRFAVPFVLQFWFFATPIAYPASLLDEPWRTLYGINPMAGVIEGLRWALLNKANPPGALLVLSSAIALLLLVSGAYYFKRVERIFADVI
jgi:lipopolysaccharide transport system permease protein